MTSKPKSNSLPGIHPNHLTYFRFAVAPLVPCLILTQAPWLHITALVLFVLGAVSDYFDGWLARKYQLTTEIGKWLDPLADKFLVLGSLWALSYSDHILSVWVFWMIFIREVLVTFCRTGWQLDGKILAAEKAGKWKLFFQTLLIVTAFFVLFAADGSFSDKGKSVIEIGDNMISFLSITVLLLTWYSGITFLINNRHLLSTPFFAKYVLAAGVGLLPKAPGTWGSMVGVLIAAFFQKSAYGYLGCFCIIALIAYIFYQRIEKQHAKDPQFFVLDEVCGIMITFAIVPVTWITVIPGFLLFRVFDILKPFPIRKLEKLPGYWGIMTDDLLAGLYAAVILWLLPL